MSEAEWKIRAAIWPRVASSVRDVLDVVGAETAWADTTVKTMMDRLVDKGVPAASKERMPILCHASVSRQDVIRTAVRSLINRAFDGALGPLMRHLKTCATFKCVLWDAWPVGRTWVT